MTVLTHTAAPAALPRAPASAETAKGVRLPGFCGVSGWFAALGDPPPRPALVGDLDVDFAVVGAGFVGVAAARRLAELCPDARIALVDAQRVGEGTSGRNSGFVIDLPHKGDLEKADQAHKQRLYGLNTAAIAWLESRVEALGIDCQWSVAGKYQAAVGERGLRYLDHFRSLLDAFGAAYRVLDRAALRAVTGTEYWSTAVFTPGNILMQPAALVRGLADTMPGNVSIFEGTPVLSITREADGGRRLQTPAGSLRAARVVMATNIYSAGFGVLKGRMVPIMTFASMTAPLAEGYGGRYDWGITPADHAGTTVRMTADRRLIIRNQYRFTPSFGAGSKLLDTVHRSHRKALVARWPSLAEVPFTHTWGGVCALSRNYTSFFGEWEDGLFVSACHNGVGAARGTISGVLLAEMACGVGSPLLRDMQAVSGMPARNPPEPFLGIGVRGRLRYAQWVSRSEL